MIVPDQLRALVVDDNAYARHATSTTLRKLGLDRIDEVESGARAIDSLLSSPYDVMFMDWYMPHMNGAAIFATSHVAAALGRVLPDGWQAALEPETGDRR